MFLVMISIGLDGYRKVPVALIDGVVVKGVVAAASPAIAQHVAATACHVECYNLTLLFAESNHIIDLLSKSMQLPLLQVTPQDEPD